MRRFVLLFLMVGATLSVTFCYANKIEGSMQDGDIPMIVKKGMNGADRSSSISVSINGHSLTMVFTENLGQVAVEVSFVGGGEVETTSLYTPSGVIIYIPYAGSYIVTFTLPNGDEYYGEFEVTD